MFQRISRSRTWSKVVVWLPAAWLLVALGLDLALARPATTVWREPKRRLLAFSDQPDNGRSTSSVHPLKNDLVMKMRLDTGVTWPVAGTILFLDPKGVDVSGPGTLELDVVRSDLSLLTLCLVEDIPGFTRDDKWQSARYECMDQELVPGTPSYRIPLEKFTTPSWWYSAAGILPSTLGPERRDRVVRLVLQTGPGTPLGKDLELRVSRIAIAPSNAPRRLGIWGAALALVLVHVSLLRLAGAKRVKESVKLPSPPADPYFLPIEAVSYADRERDAVVQCIGHDYADPDLSLEKIARSTGVPVDRVTHHVKMASGLLFKAYLNKVRGEAARKLLLETDLPIAEISQRVGYSNTPHFNRVFKELFDTTPTALRDGTRNDPPPQE